MQAVCFRCNFKRQPFAVFWCYKLYPIGWDMIRWIFGINSKKVVKLQSFWNTIQKLLYFWPAMLQKMGCRQYSICSSPTGCLIWYCDTIARGVAVVHNLSQHSALQSAISSVTTDLRVRRLKVSDRNTIGQRPVASILQLLATSLKGSYRYSLRHRRRSNTDIYPFSQSLKGSYRFAIIHRFNSEIQWLNH